MFKAGAILLVFFGGFTVMVLEIVGVRLLVKDFGSSFYVWVSQIGVILVALALGYWIGGIGADRFQRLLQLGWCLLAAGGYAFAIPAVAPRILNAIIMRHPLDQPIPLHWQKLDPALGSALVFLLPGAVLAAIAPFVIRIAATQLSYVGRISGLAYAFSTIGSVAGVFVSGYVLIDYFSLSQIFYGTGALISGLGLVCLVMDRWVMVSNRLKKNNSAQISDSEKES